MSLYLLLVICIIHFFLMKFLFFFQRYKYLIKNVLLFISYFISIDILLITLTSLNYNFGFFCNILHKIQVNYR
jgi:hypothetical protein